MTDFTYTFPEPADFIYTLTNYLQTVSKENIASLLINSSCKFIVIDSFADRDWNSYDTIVCFSVPVVSVSKITDIKKELLNAVKLVFPKETGFEIVDIEVSPIIEAPPDDEQRLSNSGSLVSSGSCPHEGLKFRSPPEIEVYKALKKRNVLFFPNATAILGGTNMKKEPDFLVCQNGKWGILEVMGGSYHTPTKAMQDHERARLFKDYGLFYIEFYDAMQCFNNPEGVVDDFLDRLSKL